MGSLNIKTYKDFMDKYFSRDYLDEDRKIGRLVDALSKNFHNDLLDEEESMPGTKLIDVLFLQEPTKKLIDRIKNLKNEKG